MVITMLVSIHSVAQSAIEASNDSDDIVTGIYYDYELSKREDPRLQCNGTLHLTLNITDDIESLILERTSHLHPEDQPPKFLIRRELPLDNHVALEDYPWRIRFRIWINYMDGSRKYTETYNINDYIDEEDLKLLYEASSAASLQDDGSDITLENGILLLRTPGEARLDVFESSGKMLCTKSIRGSESIDVHDINVSNTSIIIIKLHTAEKTATKKIYIR